MSMHKAKKVSSRQAGAQQLKGMRKDNASRKSGKHVTQTETARLRSAGGDEHS
jgi:hypothetical protein